MSDDWHERLYITWRLF